MVDRSGNPAISPNVFRKNIKKKKKQKKNTLFIFCPILLGKTTPQFPSVLLAELFWVLQRHPRHWEQGTLGVIFFSV